MKYQLACLDTLVQTCPCCAICVLAFIILHSFICTAVQWHRIQVMLLLVQLVKLKVPIEMKKYY